MGQDSVHPFLPPPVYSFLFYLGSEESQLFTSLLLFFWWHVSIFVFPVCRFTEVWGSALVWAYTILFPGDHIRPLKGFPVTFLVILMCPPLSFLVLLIFCPRPSGWAPTALFSPCALPIPIFFSVPLGFSTARFHIPCPPCRDGPKILTLDGRICVFVPILSNSGSSRCSLGWI